MEELSFFTKKLLNVPKEELRRRMIEMNEGSSDGLGRRQTRQMSLPIDADIVRIPPAEEAAREEENTHDTAEMTSYTISKQPSEATLLTSRKTKCLLYHGDCRELLDAFPSKSVSLIVTSPPYNIGKAYEQDRTLSEYLDLQAEVIEKCVRVLADDGSICWEVGNHIVGDAEILPLDIALHAIFAKHKLKLRNRIVWHFEHGLHCKKRFSGRYEVIMWYTKGNDFFFDLDPVRVPQKYPGKRHFKGPNAGKLSGNPLGKNPSDVWIFPNVKHNHREKTVHPCQFPIELVDRLILATTKPGDIVLDPFAGASSALCSAILCGRRACGAEVVKEYVEASRNRIERALAGTLPTRSAGTPVYQPGRESVARLPEEFRRVRQAVNGSTSTT